MVRFRKGLIGLLSVVVAAGFATSGMELASAAPDKKTSKVATTGRGDEGPLAPKDPLAQKEQGDKTVDELSSPQADKLKSLREQAVRLVVNGQRKVQTINGSSVVKIGRKRAPYTRAELLKLRAGLKVKPRMVDSYVELSREQTDKIFVVLTEFGTERAAGYPDQDTDPTTAGPLTFDGPLRNAIPEPDRKVDNSTIWQPDYSAQHYRQLYFGTGRGVESLKTYYEKQSSGRYSVDGMVTDWVKVKYNEARYGRSNGYPCAGTVCSNTWALLSDGLTQWVADQKAAGRTSGQIKKSLASYDQQDRYDYDGDGNFNEPDGYIDHFQIVHSGGDQADGDQNQGEDAIWSHRWFAYYTGAGTTGPARNKLGGTEIGSTGLWVGDYTIQPENGGLSVFAHEYGHDLGLPDHYDTAGGGDTAVNWWTLMAQSRARAGGDVGIGTRPADLGVWDKLQLGWLDYQVAAAGQKKTFQLGPHEYNSKKAQAVVVVLPKKQVTRTLVQPASGSHQWWSGSGNDLDTTLTSGRITLPAGPAALTFKASYDIEQGYDYAFVQVDDGSGWTSVPGSIVSEPDNQGIDGTTGGRWTPASFDLSAYAGKTVSVRFRYDTDGGAAGNDSDTSNDGFFVDDVVLTGGGRTLLSDGAETGAGVLTPAGFSSVGASTVTLYDQYYLASNRTYTAYDRYLETGPYNFGFGAALPDKVEFFPYQDGLLVNYWDTSYSDNNETQHPGGGLVLPVDAHPSPIYNLDGVPWRGRIQTYDAPFSLQRADSFTLHTNGKASYIRGAAAQPLFDDTRAYWSGVLPTVGVKTAKAGVTLRVTRQHGTSMTVRLGVSPSAATAASR